MGHLLETCVAARRRGRRRPQQCRGGQYCRASFYGLALRRVRVSGKSWSLVQRDTLDRAKNAALDECGKSGKSCRIIDAVCADGVGRWVFQIMTLDTVDNAKHVSRPNFEPPCFSALLLSTLGSAAALAQSGSSGGIGNDEKSLSGSRDTPRAIESSRPARRRQAGGRRARRAAARVAGGGGGGVDGAWVVTCGRLRWHRLRRDRRSRAAGSSAKASTDQRERRRRGTIRFQANGLTSIGSGRLSGRSGPQERSAAPTAVEDLVRDQAVTHKSLAPPVCRNCGSPRGLN